MTKIITKGWLKEDGTDEVLLDEITCTYLQNADCTEDSDEPQVIEISTRNNGAARFINIKTENWSIGNINELIEIIKDFSKRAGLNQNEK